VVVQIYHNPLIPTPPADFDWSRFLDLSPEHYGRFANRIIVRPVLPIIPDLSPLRILTDLYGIGGVESLSVSDGRAIVQSTDFQPANGIWDERRGIWNLSMIHLQVVAHFVTADLFRFVGARFLRDLLLGQTTDPVVQVRQRKFPMFIETGTGAKIHTPLVEIARISPDRYYGMRLSVRDTIAPFGPAKADDHFRTFLRLSKVDRLSAEDLRDMVRTFRTRTDLAYGYCAVDAVNVLLTYEQMFLADRKLNIDLGIPAVLVPEMRATLGSRVSTSILQRTFTGFARGSKKIGSRRKMKVLMAHGGRDLFRLEPRASRFGEQTGEVHGGLLYSRSPTRFWHESRGMMRDVDMAGCYNTILNDMSVYWGRPVILEPGEDAMTVAKAVEFAREHANDDAWLIRASGDFPLGVNALIPSTVDALTVRNWTEETKRRKQRRVARKGFVFDELMKPAAKDGCSRLYTHVVENGVVTAATWAVIQALPDAHRKLYENMLIDSLVLYPRILAADCAAEFDQLAQT
jgi:hypothetical protein